MNENQVTVCRLCMGAGEGMLPISSGQSSYAKLILVFQLKLLKRVGVPSHICSMCLDRLDAAHQFKQQILNVGKTLETLFGKTCITKAKSKLVESLSKEQIQFENTDEVPISFSEFNANDTEMSSSVNMKKSETTDLESTTSLSNNQEANFNQEVDPIAVDLEYTHLVSKMIKVEDCTADERSDTNFLHVTTRAEMDYVSIVDHIDPPSVEKILEAKKFKEVEQAKLDLSEFEVVKNCCCLICGKTYWSTKILTSHMYTHGLAMETALPVNEVLKPSSAAHRCGFCRNEFGTKRQLKSHSCPTNKPKRLQFTGNVKCSLCGKLFSMLKDLNEHIALSHMHKCIHCGKSFKREMGLVLHLETKHKKENRKWKWKCKQGKDKEDKSGTGTQKRAKIPKKGEEEIIPKSSHLEVSVIQGQVAETVMRLSSQDTVKTPLEHLQITDDLPPNSGNVLIKEEVDLGVGTLEASTIPNLDDSEANYHHDYQTQSDAALWQTVFPGKMEPYFDAPTRMEEEPESDASPLNETESNDSTVQEDKTAKCCSCLICGASFQHLSEFVNHMEDHDETEIRKKPGPPKVPCTVCSKEFTKFIFYKRHLYRGKCPETPLSAQQLEERAKRAERDSAKEAARLATASLNAFRAKGASDKWKRIAKDSVKCTLCSETFTRAQELTKHLQEHRKTNKRNNDFMCVYCDKGFRKKDLLKCHTTTCHFIDS